MAASATTTTMVSSTNQAVKKNNESYQFRSLWTGPAKLITLRTAKCDSMHSLLKAAYKEPTAIRKQPREGPVHLGRLGFDEDEHAFDVHGGPEKAVLQYNPEHYPAWKKELKDISTRNPSRRQELLSIGGFGENIAVEDSADSPPMDERTMCVGDLVSFRKGGKDGVEQARMRVTGPRMPCFKLNHRFGISNMSQRVQDKHWTGWLYSIDTEGDVEVGSDMVLLERPFPDWPVARIQHYLYKDMKNLDMMKEALDTLGDKLVYDARGLFENRLTKGVEDMNERLQGKATEAFVSFRLREKLHETKRISEFIFERVDKIPETSKHFMVAQSGSHIRLRLKVKGKTDMQLLRAYSVVTGDSNTFRLGIALADTSRGGSTFLHNNLQVGDIIEASDKFANTFPLQPAEDVSNHIFLAGGIGITAFLDHMKACLKTKQRFHLHYMIRDQSDYAFKNLIEKMIQNTTQNSSQNIESDSDTSSGSVDTDSILHSSQRRDEPAKVSIYVSADGHRCNIPDLLTHISKDTKSHIYICGSEKLSDSVKQSASSLNIPNSRLHFEQFSVDTSGDPFVAELDQSKKTVKVSAEQSLLEALKEAGMDIPSSCEAGNCGTCTVRVKCGKILHKGSALPDDEKAGYEGVEEGDMLSCVSRGTGTIHIDL